MLRDKPLTYQAMTPVFVNWWKSSDSYLRPMLLASSVYFAHVFTDDKLTCPSDLPSVLVQKNSVTMELKGALICLCSLAGNFYMLMQSRGCWEKLCFACC